MASEEIYPKVTERVSSFSEQVADTAVFNGLSTGVFKGIHAAKNERASACIEGKPINECDTVRQATRATLELIGNDNNSGFSGWVGYEGANATCGDCNNVCSARVFWQDGKPTEKVKFLFYEEAEPDAVLHIDIKSYSS